MGRIEDMNNRMKDLEKRDDLARERMLEIQKIEKMPFHLRIQSKGWEDVMKRVEDTQKIVFQAIIKKHHPHLINEWKDLFAEYMILFLKGKSECIKDFLYGDKHAPMNKRQLKKEFLDEK